MTNRDQALDTLDLGQLLARSSPPRDEAIGASLQLVLARSCRPYFSYLPFWNKPRTHGSKTDMGRKATACCWRRAHLGVYPCVRVMSKPHNAQYGKSAWRLSGTPESGEAAFVITRLQFHAFDHRAVRPDRPTNLVRLLQEFACHVDRQVA
jgi:hypothetical protein